jgi:hypothetical protein
VYLWTVLQIERRKRAKEITLFCGLFFQSPQNKRIAFAKQNVSSNGASEQKGLLLFADYFFSRLSGASEQKGLLLFADYLM